MTLWYGVVEGVLEWRLQVWLLIFRVMENAIVELWFEPWGYLEIVEMRADDAKRRAVVILGVAAG